MLQWPRCLPEAGHQQLDTAVAGAQLSMHRCTLCAIQLQLSLIGKRFECGRENRNSLMNVTAECVSPDEVGFGSNCQRHGFNLVTFLCDHF
mmetsp:Transcript_11327/g.33636  ORF Transcript_11327/g.33636 Transcript_11327/m.33636 type:complete len:91 (+) Transcript_11327:1047-1319(+)